ncbi:hypothetical protein EVAR_37468_1 [Eumeta japonica]|uniref:Neurotrophin 1 N-terminal domain-containing protein n=1 Tax=Eumeta variegata TaxID=151549 RepID=A0A4C1XFG8_EUMVA|nr:hypothetical protein EVAR_37468_1 [Eumeta japonica]
MLTDQRAAAGGDEVTRAHLVYGESAKTTHLRPRLFSKAEDDLSDFNYSSDFDMSTDKGIMLAQESKQQHVVVEPPISIVKPKGVINSHRPQYDIDSLEADLLDENKYSDKLNDLFDAVSKNLASRFRSREAMIRDAVLKALERKDHVGKFAQILPIVRAMTDSQRVALASLVASQVSTPPGRSPLNLSQRAAPAPAPAQLWKRYRLRVSALSIPFRKFLILRL